MERTEIQKPNSHERFTTAKSWSDLPTDLLSLVFERLTFASFQRAKSVCSFWHSASKQCVPKRQIHPWLILFPKDDDSCSLFNPEEKHKLYKTHHLDLEFTKSKCDATYGSWLLMRDPMHNLFIVNLFTHNKERINLPPFESQLGTITMDRTQDGKIRFTSATRPLCRGLMRSPVFWIDDKTKDYVVLWSLAESCVVYTKNGDSFWNQLPDSSHCDHMIFSDRKLYLLSVDGLVKIFDFSGGIPKRCLMHHVLLDTFYRSRKVPPVSNPKSRIGTKLVVRVTGQVLTVDIWLRWLTRAWSFRIHSVCSSGFQKQHGLVTSLGDEAMLLDQDVTVLANENDGLTRNCIYFTYSYSKNTYDILIFNLETQQVELPHTFDSSSVPSSGARWFSPSFT